MNRLTGVLKGVIRPGGEQSKVSRNIARAITVPSLNNSYSQKIVVVDQDYCLGQTGRSSKLCRRRG